MAMGNHFSFDNAEFEQSVAHQGRGSILFSRRMEMATLSGCNFLDMSVLPPGTSIGLHSHDKADEEIYIVISGRGRMTVETTSFWVGPGDVIVNPPGGTHGLENLGNEDLRLVVIDVPYPRSGHRSDLT
jgi:mannose-6-phosphate isomerase-like protein (cupin superfamily)